ncbi:MAG: long-chain fatty acid--CoA ligase [Planctomycetota bacterium]
MQAKVWHKAYDPGVPRELGTGLLTLPALLERAVDEFPGRTALIFQHCRMTYRRLKDQVDRLATALARLGVEKGARVAVHLPNLPQAVIAHEAVLALGAQAVMTNPLYVEREIEHQWNDAGCQVAVTADFLYARRLAGIRGRLPVRDYILASIPEYLCLPLRLLAPFKLRRRDPPLWARVEPGPGIHFFRKLIRSTPPAPPQVEIGLEDVAVLQYTGGTTGVSKGAMLTHGNLSVNVVQTQAWFGELRQGGEVFLAALPYFHIFGLTVCMHLPVAVGASIVLIPNPRDIRAILGATERYRITIFPAVPALFDSVNRFPGVEKRNLRSIQACFSGSAPLPEKTLERFERLTGSRVLEGFGLTETSPVTHVNPMHGRRKIGSIGIPVPETDARIVDPGDGVTELPVGKAGELAIRGPQVMLGYWNMPEETGKVLKNGWLLTGDLAVMDEDGFFRIVGRKKDMILASGYNIFPDEIDRVLETHPDVLEACTIGVPDPHRGETVKSFLVLGPGSRLTEADLEAFCRERLAAYKVPQQFEFRDELPRSAVMKLLRRVLREEELAKTGA